MPVSVPTAAEQAATAASVDSLSVSVASLTARVTALEAGTHPVPIPPVVNPNVSVNLASGGKSLSPYVFGLATGALADNAFALATNDTVKASLATIRSTLIRVNANNATTPAGLATWIANAATFMDPAARMIMGVGPAGADTSIPPATWATRAVALAQAAKSAGKEISYWEIGNEPDSMPVGSYVAYFNAIADALHSVNPAYAIGGPIASWWNGVDLNAWANGIGSRAGFVCFHSYAVNSGDPTATAYSKAARFTDIVQARAMLSAHPNVAQLPIMLGEYNMCGSQQSNGIWGIPSQATYVGGVYIALLLAQCFNSDPAFTMAALWDAVQDGYYGVVGNAANGGDNATVTPQGAYLGYAGHVMPGQQCVTGTALASLQVMATKMGGSYAVQLVNYGTVALTVALGITGGTPSGTITRWEFGKAMAPTKSTQAGLQSVAMPSEAVVILSGTYA